MPFIQNNSADSFFTKCQGGENITWGFNAGLSAISEDYISNGAVDSPDVLRFFGSLRTTFYHFLNPALLCGNFRQPAYREIFLCIHTRGFETSATGLQCQFNSNPKVIIRKRFFYISFGSGIFRTFQDAVFSMGGQENKGNCGIR